MSEPLGLSVIQNSERMQARLGLGGGVTDLALVLGSGLRLSLPHRILGQIPYAEILDLPSTSVAGHARLLSHIQLEQNDKRLLLFEGRFHLYEGLGVYAVESLIDVVAILGCNRLLITNAAGGISPALRVADLMLIERVLDFQNAGELANSPCGLEDCLHKPPLIVNSYLTGELRRHPSLKSGAYIAVLGPNYETPSEISLFQALGADAVGMSTYLEIRRALRLGLNVAGVSIITNSWQEQAHPTHQEVLNNARLSEVKLNVLIAGLLNQPPS